MSGLHHRSGLHRRSARLIAACGAVLLLLALSACAGTGGRGLDAFGAGTARPLVLFLSSGLTWDDVSADTPTLLDLAEHGAAGNLVARSVELVACPVDGALTISAGRRADAARPDGGVMELVRCQEPELDQGADGGAVTVPDWQDYLDRAAGRRFDARLGTLGDRLGAAGRTRVALGPLATVALADSQGSTPHAWRSIDDLPAALALEPEVVVADLPGVPAGHGAERATQARALDATLATAMSRLPQGSTVLLASIADAPGPPALQLITLSHTGGTSAGADAGSGSGSGITGPAELTSNSTRQPGMVQNTDLLPTLMTALGLPVPDVADGSPMLTRASGGSAQQTIGELRDQQGAAMRWQALRTWYTALTVLILAAIALVLALALRAGTRRADHGGEDGAGNPARRNGFRTLELVLLTGAALPAADLLTALVPWWRSSIPLLALVFLALAISAALAVGAVLIARLFGRPDRTLIGPAVALALLALVVLVADVATGSRLSVTTAMGGDPLVGGRFYGFGNPVFGVFGACVIFAGLGLAHALRAAGRARWAAPALIALGVIASLVDLLPSLGADVGGPPALLPAMAFLALRAAGVRLTWVRAVLVLLGTAALVVAVFVLDWLRPAEQRTHLGRFVQTVIDGGGNDVVVRKLAQNVEVLTSSPIAAAMPLLAVLVVWALARPARFGMPLLSEAYRRIWLLPEAGVALVLMSVIGFAANDSGTSIPPAVALVSLPLLAAMCCATALRRGPAEPSAAPPPRPAESAAEPGSGAAPG